MKKQSVTTFVYSITVSLLFSLLISGNYLTPTIEDYCNSDIENTTSAEDSSEESESFEKVLISSNFSLNHFCQSPETTPGKRLLFFYTPVFIENTIQPPEIN